MKQEHGVSSLALSRGQHNEAPLQCVLGFLRQQECATSHLTVVHSVLDTGMPGQTCKIPIERGQKTLGFGLNGVKSCGSEQQKKICLPCAVKCFQQVLEYEWNYLIEMQNCTVHLCTVHYSVFLVTSCSLYLNIINSHFLGLKNKLMEHEKVKCYCTISKDSRGCSKESLLNLVLVLTGSARAQEKSLQARRI